MKNLFLSFAILLLMANVSFAQKGFPTMPSEETIAQEVFTQLKGFRNTKTAQNIISFHLVDGQVTGSIRQVLNTSPAPTSSGKPTLSTVNPTLPNVICYDKNNLAFAQCVAKWLMAHQGQCIQITIDSNSFLSADDNCN